MFKQRNYGNIFTKKKRNIDVGVRGLYIAPIRIIFYFRKL